MKKILFVICLFTIFSCNAQKSEVLATKNKTGDLVGVASKAQFLEAPYNDWFNYGYEDYTVDEETIEKLKPLLKGVKIKAFMGTWCGDSQEQTPVFYKVLDQAGFKDKNLEMITVNRSKKTPDNLEAGLDILRVPTFIFYKNDKEIGRFVEYPRESVEKDMLKILSGETYKHSYEN